MGLKFDTKQVLKIALASETAANDLIAAIDSDTDQSSDALSGATLAITGAATIGGTCLVDDTLTIATGKVLKVGTHQVVGAQQAAVVPVAVTFSATAPSTYASPTGALTISAGATPTVAELLAYCDELRANIVSLQAVLHAHGLTA